MLGGWKLDKGEWDGNHWPSVDIAPYEPGDFLKALACVCAALGVPLPPITDTLDGYAAELTVNGARITALMDNWTFSIAAERVELRDRIFDALSAAGGPA